MDTYVKDIKATTSTEEVITIANRHMNGTYDPPSDGIDMEDNLWWYQLHATNMIAYYLASRPDPTRDTLVTSYGIIVGMGMAGCDWEYEYDSITKELGDKPVSIPYLKEVIDGMDDGL